MLKQEGHGGATNGGGGSWTRVCHTCRAAASVVYCRADMAYLCAGCDARVHAANRVASRHERVWVCEACESAPAAFTCKADAAALCATCDADIHSANPLARRHHRVPIMPISGCLYGPPATEAVAREGGFLEYEEEDDDEEAASWLLLNPTTGGGVKNNNGVDNQGNNGYLFGGDVEEYLDLVELNNNNNSCNESQYPDHNLEGLDGQDQVKNDGSECVVPVQQHNYQDLEMEYEASKAAFSYSTTTGTLSHSVSFSSMDASIVPDSKMINDITNSHSRSPKGTIDLFSSPPLQVPPQFTPMDREARVLRYREKRKTRKFEKTIRYASRKAYAETRPRIKGRFAKRRDVEIEVDQMFSSTMMAETEYGIVPSF
ncbi:hypothetical protein Scep_016851 [Stephania cephalantha]|uniref:Uncharacterized protein n=1 Tax=Stephania cephalantha TaxID=152367 RepID=A0AAP0IPS7_9MAGN